MISKVLAVCIIYIICMIWVLKKFIIPIYHGSSGFKRFIVVLAYGFASFIIPALCIYWAVLSI